MLPGARMIRLWGKINGTEGDYLIAETKVERKGAPTKGFNEFSYFVLPTQGGSCAWSQGGGWEELPDVKEEHIKAARQIRWLFSGSLNASVGSSPPFPGSERELLRAQISRISHGSFLAPTGFFQLDEDTGVLGEAPEFAGPPLAEALNPPFWVHQRGLLLKRGSTDYPEIPEDADEENPEIQALRAQMEAEPPVPPLRSLEEEPNAGSDWRIAQYGEKAIFKSLEGEGEKSYGVVCIRSKIWPGSVSLYALEGGGNLYVGSGDKVDGDREKLLLFSVAPPMVCKEPVGDLEEFPEPYPPDTADDNAEEEGEGQEEEEEE